MNSIFQYIPWVLLLIALIYSGINIFKCKGNLATFSCRFSYALFLNLLVFLLSNVVSTFSIYGSKYIDLMTPLFVATFIFSLFIMLLPIS